MKNIVVSLSMCCSLLIVFLFLCCSLPVMAQDAWRIEVPDPLQGDYYGITSANGQIGLVSSRSPLKVDKVVVGGLYDIYANGRVNNYFPNINPLDIELKVDGSRAERGNINNYTQAFNFRNGTFSGRFSFQDKVAVDYTTVALRHMPFGYMTDVQIVAQEDCRLSVLNQHRAAEALRNTEDYFSYIDNKANPFVTHYPHYVLMTTMAESPTGRYEMGACTAFMFPDNQSGGIETEVCHRADRGVGRQTMEFECRLAAGDTLHFALVGNILASNIVADVRNEVERLTIYQLLEGYDRLWQRHNTAWQQLWESDIIIKGDKQAQQDIHSMLYHLYAFNRAGSGLSCSPMGLSGLGYNGHAFWDAETWMFPVLAVMQPQIGKEMLAYRFQHLQAAKQKAYMHGYAGALYPWESAHTGQEEVAPNNMYPCAEHHITGDIAIAAYQYYMLTGDKEWLAEVGYPILEATADFWVSRTDYDSITDSYSLLNLIGADEWSENPQGGKQIDNNAYTIGVAKTNLQYATRAAKALGKPAKREWTVTAEGLQLKYLPNGVVAEYDTYNGQITKQADVSLLSFPLHIITDTTLMRKNLEYYMAKVPEKRTPAMSKSIYAVLYCRLGEADKALYYFNDSYLPNLNPPFRVIAEFNGGTNPYFLTGAGGTLQSLIFGFAGMDITEKGLVRQYPAILPDNWEELIIKIAGKKDIVIVNQDK